MNDEVNRIREAMQRCRERIAQMQAGERGVRTGVWTQTKEGLSGAGVAFERQLLAEQNALHKLESEYLAAMIACNAWPPEKIIAKMTAPLPVPQIIEREPTAEEVKSAVRALIEKIPDDANISSLKELLS